jgi:hypothetical protein
MAPDEWSVAMLENFLVSALPRALHERRQAKLIKSICIGRNITVQVEWVDLVSKEGPFVQIDDALAVIAGVGVAKVWHDRIVRLLDPF